MTVTGRWRLRPRALGVWIALLLASVTGALLVFPSPSLAVSPPTVPGGLTPALTGGLGGLGGGGGVGVGSLAGTGGLAGAGGLASSATTDLALSAVGSWVLGGAQFVLDETSHVLSETTTPRLTSTWFSSTYWRVAAIAGVLTLPFLFAAAAQALMSSDITLLARAALGYLPLAGLATAVAAPLAMLLLAASDQLAGLVSSAAGQQSARFLAAAGGEIVGLTQISVSPFIAFFIGAFTVAVALVLWLELLIREAAVYVVVLLLPLAFAALAWPARRIWAIRSVELLLALILSKFAIVAVLSLGGAALGQSVDHSITGFLAGAVLLILAAFAPWALLRLLPLTELAAGAASSLRSEARTTVTALQQADIRATQGHHWASRMAQLGDTVSETGRDAALSEKEKVDASQSPAGHENSSCPVTAAAAAATATGAGPPPNVEPDPRPAPSGPESASRERADEGTRVHGTSASVVAERPGSPLNQQEPIDLAALAALPPPTGDATRQGRDATGLEPAAAGRDLHASAAVESDPGTTTFDVPDPTPPSQSPDEGEL